MGSQEEHGACASELVQVFSKDQHQAQCSFAGDSLELSWNETQARGLSQELLDLFVGISQLIHTGHNGEAFGGAAWGFLGRQKCFLEHHYGWVGWMG